MKKVFLVAIMLINCFAVISQRTYYVDSDGGQDFKSLSEISNFSFTTGDKVLFKRGQTFYGQLNLKNLNGVSFGAYGTGNNPLISGSKALAGKWTQHSLNIWKLTDTSLPDNVRLLSINSIDKDFGKWPDEGWRRYSNPFGSERFDDGLGMNVVDGYWNGAEAVVGISQYGYVIENYNVLDQKGNTFYIDGSFYDLFPGTNNAYYLQNHINTLSTQDEWCYKDKTVYIYSITSPDSKLIEVSNQDTTIVINNCSQITFEDLQVTHSNYLTVFVNGSNSISFSKILINHAAFDGVQFINSNGIVIENSEIFDIGNIGIYVESDNVRIRDNKIHSIGMDRGAGGSSGGQSVGLKIWSGTNILAQYNEIYDIGYNGITMINYTCFNAVISHNYVHDVLLTKSDGGAIYTWQKNPNHKNGNVIDHNIVVDVDKGVDQGMIIGNRGEVFGIYTDDRSDNILISNNTVEGGKFSLYLHSNAVMDVVSNTLIGGEMFLIGMKDDNGTIEMDNLTMKGNIFVMEKTTKAAVYFKNMTDELNGGGVTFSDDYIVDPYNQLSNVSVVNAYNSAAITGTSWDFWNGLSWTSNTSGAPVVLSDYPDIPAEEFVLFEFNASKNPKVVALYGDYVNVKNEPVSGSVTIAPYESIVLFKISSKVNPCASFDFNGNITDSDFGQSNGSITLTVFGGASPYKFVWADGNVQQNRTNLSAGDYKVVVSDAQNCSKEKIFTVKEKVDPCVGFSISSILTNSTNDNGAINLSITGGTSPYTIIWSDGITLEDREGLSVGNYTVNVTDSNGCMVTGNYAIQQIVDPCLGLAIKNTVTNSDFGKNNGIIDVTINGGTQPYSFLWNDGVTTEDRNQLAPGQFTLIVNDSKACEVKETFSIIELPDPCQGYSIQNSVINSDFGASNGSIDITVNGGVPPYSYLWNDGITTEDRSQLSPGQYSITITDNNACEAIASFTIEELAEPCSGFNIQNVIVNSDFGKNNGLIDITVSGGTQPYSFFWNDGITIEDRNQLSPGQYTVDVTDAKGCKLSNSFVIEELVDPCVNLNVSAVLSNSEFNKNNGAIDITVTGGAEPYRFIWSDGTGTEDRANLPAGNYKLYVTDEVGCEKSGFYVLEELADPCGNFIVTGMVKNSDNNENNGEIILTVTGGVSPYSFNWSDGLTIKDRSGLQPGNYNVSVNDINGCSLLKNFIIQEKPIEFKITRFYPNPTKDLVAIEYSSPVAATVLVEVIDLAGEPVKKLSFNCIQGVNKFTIDLSLDDKGIVMKKGKYEILLKTENESNSVQVIKR